MFLSIVLLLASALDITTCWYNTTVMDGFLCVILTAHVPYVRSAGRAPEGEDALHETIAFALLPTLNVLCDLRDAGFRPRVGVAYSPVLLEQLADNVVQKHFLLWMEQWQKRVADALVGWSQAGDQHRIYLGRFYLDWAQTATQSFVVRHRRDLVATLRDLCADGIVEPLASSATYAYLPGLARPESVGAQVDTGVQAVTRLLQVRPRGIWLPECGYHPHLTAPLHAAGLRYTVVDPSSLPDMSALTGLHPLATGRDRITAFVRDTTLSQQVWSAELGYPGDPLYRSSQRDPVVGLGLWRHGLVRSGELYDPYYAYRRAQEHAEHFRRLVTERLAPGPRQDGRPGIAVVPLDAEVLGRDWFEGPAWLRALLEPQAGQPNLALTTPSNYLRAHPPAQSVLLREGSWGQASSNHGPASNSGFPLRSALHQAEERLAALVRRAPRARGPRTRLLNQAVRELLLAQSGDWSLPLGRGDTVSEALDRPVHHLHRCERLCTLAERADVVLSAAEQAYLEQLEELDNPFSSLHYRVFTEGQSAQKRLSEIPP